MLIRIAQTATRLRLDELKTIGTFISGEHSKLILRSKNYDLHRASNLSKLMERVECRPYQNILNFLVLKEAAAIVRAVHCYCVLYRAQNFSRLLRFNSFGSSDLLAACQKPLCALEEEK